MKQSLLRRGALYCAVLSILLVGCRQAAETPAIPTQAVVAGLPTEAPPSPTSDLPPTLTPAPPPQTEGAGTGTADDPSATEDPSTGPSATSTPQPVDAAVNITQPAVGAALLLGSTVTAGGLANLNAGETVSVLLLGAGGTALLEEAAAAGSDGGWQAQFTVPEVTTGPAQLVAVIRAADGSAVAQNAIPVTLVVDESFSGRYLTLNRPVLNEEAVAGFYLFFDGTVQQPAGGRLTLELLVDNCQTPVATQGFSMNSSGYWQGYLYVPRNLAGAACARVSTGAAGEDVYREAVVPVNLLPFEGDNSYGVRLHNPPSGAQLFAGQTITVYGLAYNARDDIVVVDLRRADGQVLSQATGSVGEYGYWEAVLVIPFGAEGEAELSAIIGDAAAGDFAEQKVRLDLLPAPTPTPGP